jgi:hypothetical protein
MQLMHTLALAGAVTLAGCASHRPPAPPVATAHADAGAGADANADTQAIRQVVETFRLALLNKDKPRYMGLFFSSQAEGVGWQAVVDDAKLALIRKDRPQAIKARPIPANNFIALIDAVVASPVVEEERITKLRITTDGEIASAWFNYAYLSGGQVSNWGQEHWQLVRTEQGWKIFSVVYTIRDPAP